MWNHPRDRIMSERQEFSSIGCSWIPCAHWDVFFTWNLTINIVKTKSSLHGNKTCSSVWLKQAFDRCMFLPDNSAPVYVKIGLPVEISQSLQIESFPLDKRYFPFFVNCTLHTSYPFIATSINSSRILWCDYKVIYKKPLSFVRSFPSRNASVTDTIPELYRSIFATRAKHFCVSERNFSLTMFIFDEALTLNAE